MELDKNIEQELAELLANPEKVSPQHTAMLNELLQEYPYYQPLHLLLAKAGQQTEQNTHLAKASVYTSGQTLHHFLFERKFPALETEEPEDSGATAMPEVAAIPEVTDEEPEVQQPEEESQEIVEASEETAAVPEMQEEPAEKAAMQEEARDVPEEEEHEIPSAAGIPDEQETFEEITEDIMPLGHEENEPSVTAQQIPEEEVFEEIAEVDFNNYRPFRNSDQEDQAENEPQQESVLRKNSLEDDFVFESIVSSDFFAFENKFSTEEVTAVQEKHEVKPPFIEEHDEAAAAETENSQLSNYHDEKLPYTFLWWLAKTRKEHQNIFQPYVSPKKGGSQELQQQYVEHIFHMQSHLTGNEALLGAAENSKPANKDFEIIESFIRNDPQITPPNAEQIDNENKAKKSAEDQNDLVSETLANIYIEQMLYDKAIETYEKLSLKFPEKSRYFADLIQSIEKKI